MKLIQNRKGDVLAFALIFPIFVFLINFVMTYGLAEHVKSVTITAAREGARTYAVTHDEGKALTSASFIMQKSLSSQSDYFSPDKDVSLSNDGEFVVCSVNYRMPVVAPAMFKLIGVNKVLDNYMPIGASARFIKEAENGD